MLPAEIGQLHALVILNLSTNPPSYPQRQMRTVCLHVENFEGLVAPTVPGDAYTRAVFPATLESLWASLNFTHDKDPGTKKDAPSYIGYEVAANDYTSDAGAATATATADNQTKMNMLLRPRLFGFLKTLWGLPLVPGEGCRLANVGRKERAVAACFEQCLVPLPHGPVGGGEYNWSLAYWKATPVHNPDGGTSAHRHIVDPLHVMGQAPFGGNPWNVLQMFYTLVTPPAWWTGLWNIAKIRGVESG